MKRIRFNDTLKRERELVSAALTAAETYGYANLTREHVRKHSGTSLALISYYFTPFSSIKREIALLAIIQNKINIIAAALSAGDIDLTDLSHEVREQLAANYAKQLNIN